MSIRLLAIELYRVMKEVEDLEKELEDPSLPPDEKSRVQERARVARAERDRIKAMLDGAKQD